MASPISIQFIELALSSNSPFNLSYLDPNQKWLIRNHLLSFLQDFPSFSPTFGSFVHHDGMAANLLCVTGNLQLSGRATPRIPLTIWLHENHPFMAPIVVVTPSSDDPVLRDDHPFVDHSGTTTCPYLQTWAHPRCSLSNLVRNLARLFSYDHPLLSSPATAPPPATGFAHPLLVSKREALDRLAGAFYYDVAHFNALARREMEELTKLQGEMAKRVGSVEGMIGGLVKEKAGLKKRAMELAEQADVVTNWLRFNEPEKLAAMVNGDEIEKAFETVEPESETVLDCLAGDIAVEDTIYALEKAVERGVVSFEGYVKQVRSLAREQFYHRALLVKLRGSSVLHWTH